MGDETGKVEYKLWFYCKAENIDPVFLLVDARGLPPLDIGKEDVIHEVNTGRFPIDFQAEDGVPAVPYPIRSFVEPPLPLDVVDSIARAIWDSSSNRGGGSRYNPRWRFPSPPGPA